MMVMVDMRFMRFARSLVFPYNLAEWLHDASDGEYEFTASGVRAMLETLTDRERRIMEARWAGMQTYENVAKAHGVTKERIRQVEHKALRKLCHPSRMIEFASIPRKELMAVLAEKSRAETSLKLAEERIDALIAKVEPIPVPTLETHDSGEEMKNDLLDKGIDYLDLSVRSYNCLWRARKCTIRDVVELSEYDIKKIRNLGVKSYDEIVAKVHDLGLEMSWENHRR